MSSSTRAVSETRHRSKAIWTTNVNAVMELTMRAAASGRAWLEMVAVLG
jgi:hypothetical protein